MIHSCFPGTRRSQPFAGLLRRDSSLGAEDDARATQIIGRKLHCHLVARQDPDVVHPHLAGYETQDDVAVFQFDPEGGVGEVLDDLALHFNQIFLCHPISPVTRSL